MSDKKIKFSVEDATIINENPNSNFAVLSLDFFASGDNLHDLYVSEETLLRTADTIKNCPLVWKYDETLDDVYTHDKDEVPCGFVPETSEIKQRVLPDGRTMLSVVAYVWKRYTGALLGFFKRDGGKKPVSVEMSVYKMKKLDEEKYELLDFKYEGITILGSFVTPAIPLAHAQVLSFADIAEEYNKDYKEEFPKQYIDMATSTLVTFPYKNIGDINPSLKGITPPISLGQANQIAAQADSIGSDGEKNGWAIAIASFKKTHHVEDGKWVSNKAKMSSGEESMNEPENLIFELEDELEKEDLSVKEEKDFTSENEVISENSNDESVVIEPVDASIDMAKEEEKKEEEEEKEPEEEKPEEEEEKEKKIFEFPKRATREAMSALFVEDEDVEDEEDKEDIKMAREEISKEEVEDFSVIMAGLFAKINQMSKKMKVYMSEIEQLRLFKANIEETQKSFAVEETIRQLEEKVIIPEEARAEMLAEAEKYSFSDIELWKTLCKAKSFDFVVRDNKEAFANVKKAGLPFGDLPEKSKTDLWR